MAAAKKVFARVRALREKALKLVSQSKYQPAVEVYLELIELEPNEGEWPRRAADCYWHLKKNTQRMKFAVLASKIYAESGLVLKAIAMCKIALSIDPNHTESQERLKEVHQKKRPPKPLHGNNPAVRRLGRVQLRKRLDERRNAAAKEEPKPSEQQDTGKREHRNRTRQDAAAALRRVRARRARELEAEARVGAKAADSPHPTKSSQPPESHAPFPPSYHPPQEHNAALEFARQNPLMSVSPPSAPPPKPPTGAGLQSRSKDEITVRGVPSVAAIRPSVHPPLASFALSAHMPSRQVDSNRPIRGNVYSLALGDIQGAELATDRLPPIAPLKASIPPAPVPVLPFQESDKKPPHKKELADSVMALKEERAWRGHHPAEEPIATSEKVVLERLSPQKPEPAKTPAQASPEPSSTPAPATPSSTPTPPEPVSTPAPEPVSTPAPEPVITPAPKEDRSSIFERSSPAPRFDSDSPRKEPHSPLLESGATDVGEPEEEVVDAPPADATLFSETDFENTPLFSQLDPSVLHELITHVELIELEPQEVLFSEGDTADAMYVVVEGAMIAMAVGDGSAPIELARLEEGEFFGEIGLLSDQPRQAGVSAAEHCRLLRFSRDTIAALIDHNADFLSVLLQFLRDRLVEDLILTSPLFAPLGEEQRLDLSDEFEFLEIAPDSLLLDAGQQPIGMYVLLTGEALCSTPSRPGSLRHLGPGDLFGERALLHNAPASIQVRTITKCFAICLPSDSFREIIMTHPTVLEYVSASSEKEPGRAIEENPLLGEHLTLF